MGVIIYPTANLNIEGNLPPFYQDQIEGMKDDWGMQIFRMEYDEISFVFDMREASDPLENIESYLDKLIQYAKDNDCSISGEVIITSDWSDYDNILIDIKDNEKSYGNSEVREATSEELIKELQRRGYTVEPPQEEMEL